MIEVGEKRGPPDPLADNTINTILYRRSSSSQAATVKDAQDLPGQAPAGQRNCLPQSPYTLFRT